MAETDDDPGFPFLPFEDDEPADGLRGDSADFGEFGWSLDVGRRDEEDGEGEASVASTSFRSVVDFEGGDGFLRMGLGRKPTGGRRLGEV